MSRSFHAPLATAFAAMASLAIAAVPAHAVLVFPGGAPALLDPTKEAVYFTETAVPGGGYYTITNNTAASEGAGLSAVGVSNTDTIAYIESFGSTFGCESTWCYASLNLNEDNWDTEVIASGNTGFDLFGDISNVLDPGENTINFYVAVDGDLQSGESWDGFWFGDGLPASQLFVVVGNFVGSGGTPLPEPGTALLMLTGLAGLARFGRR